MESVCKFEKKLCGELCDKPIRQNESETECGDSMMFKKQHKPYRANTTKDTLVIIGNGFDRWQGLDTGYYHFRDYYLEHRDEIMRKLRIKKIPILTKDGKTISISDVELIYGDPFHPKELSDDFWGVFETSLDQIDAERINLFFGKERHDLREMNKSLRNANRILKEAFCRWIQTITIDEKNTGCHFGDNCLFVNFNYTDTLKKRFGVRDADEFHIHGEATDKNSIVFGHSSHPHLPDETLYRFGGRFRGLFYIEHILYQTDKHVDENINLLRLFLALHGVIPKDIKHVYVLGHSISLPDLGYFSFLANVTRTSADESEVATPNSEEDTDSLEALHLRMQYAIQHGGYGVRDEKIDIVQKQAVERQYKREQDERSRILEHDFHKLIQKALNSDNQDQTVSSVSMPRTEDAMWHITCYSDKDRLWAEAVMKELGCTKYKLYNTIDECLEQFITRMEISH